MRARLERGSLTMASNAPEDGVDSVDPLPSCIPRPRERHATRNCKAHEPSPSLARKIHELRL
ncbi:hypothetical protein BDV11DRAFT_189576, partial [Aspergillus similis]